VSILRLEELCSETLVLLLKVLPPEVSHRVSHPLLLLLYRLLVDDDDVVVVEEADTSVR